MPLYPKMLRGSLILLLALSGYTLQGLANGQVATAQLSESSLEAGEAALEKGLEEYKEAQYIEAKASLERALVILKQVPESEDHIKAFNSLGELALLEARFPIAQKHYQEALRLSIKLEKLGEQAIAQNGLGKFSKKIGQNEAAIVLHQKALTIASEIPDTQIQSAAFNGIGEAYLSLGKYDSAKYDLAIENYNSAQETAANDDFENRAIALNGLGNVYVAQEKYDDALSKFQEALEIAQNIKNPSEKANALANLQKVYKLMQNPEGFTPYQEIVNELLSQLENSPIKSEIAKRLHASRVSSAPETQSPPNNSPKSPDPFDKLSPQKTRNKPSPLILSKKQSTPDDRPDLCEEADDSSQLSLPVQALNYHNASKAYLGKDDFGPALSCNQLALTKAQGVDVQLQADALSTRGDISTKQEDAKTAIAFYKQSINIYESIRLDLQALSRDEQSSYTQSIASTYRNLASLLIEQDRLSEAHQVIELLKFRELKNLSFGKKDTPQDPKGHALSITEEEKESITADLPNIAQSITAAPPIHPSQLSSNPFNQKAKQLLSYQPNSALIYQILTSEKLWILLVTPDGKIQKFSSEIGRGSIASQVSAFRSEIFCVNNLPEFDTSGQPCDHRKSFLSESITHLQESSKPLYSYLIPDELDTVLKQRNITHITFALDGDMRNLPIAALHDGRQYLIEKFSLSQVISASLTDNTTSLQSNSALGIGITQGATVEIPPEDSDKYKELPEVSRELSSLFGNNQKIGALRGSTLLDQNAILSNIKQNISGRSILHIASHAIFRPNSLENSYILLGGQQSGDRQSNDGRRYWSIAKMEAESDQKLLRNVHLVTLSACQTGLGGYSQNGMEIPGISYAFMNQGVKAVNASLWSVNDGATANLMGKYYETLATGPNLTKAQAMRQVQVALLKNKTSQSMNDSRHPYYWAAFVLMGNSR
jgi:CHAT domain-containing protein/tetratricopeptide (TPR) repeat protein